MSVFPDLRARLRKHEVEPDTSGDIVEDRARQIPEVRSDRALVREAVALWAATRIVFAIFTYFAVVFEAQPAGGRLNLSRFGPSMLLDAWRRWDGNWYLSIATNGYSA